MANSTLSSCPPPFLNLAHFQRNNGDTNARFCGQISPSLSCCLPCPLEQWIYSNSLPRYVKIANWFNVPALVCQVFLLATFIFLPQERAKVHGRYLSVGLCIGLILLELAFIIPLGTRPNFCYDAITPNDMYTSLSCAWTGALLELGSMAGCVWILLRSLYTHLRVCWDVELTKRFVWIAHGLGWGLPALFLAISLPITKLSYRLTSTCLPNPHASFVTWFGWLITFALLGALIQVATTGYCLAVFMRSFFAQSSSKASPNLTKVPVGSAWEEDANSPAQQRPGTIPASKRLAWRRVQQVLALQWRSIVLSFLVIVEVVYSGIIYVLMTGSEERATSPKQINQINVWSECLIDNDGDKNACLPLAKPLRLAEGQVVATLLMASLIGIFTFCLMLRWSMLVGWWELVRRPSRRDSIDFELVQPGGGPKHMSLTRPLVSEQMGIEMKRVSVPPPVHVTKRQEAGKSFDFGSDDAEEKERAKQEMDDVV